MALLVLLTRALVIVRTMSPDGFKNSHRQGDGHAVVGDGDGDDDSHNEYDSDGCEAVVGGM